MRSAMLALVCLLSAFAGCAGTPPAAGLTANPGALLTIPADDPAAVHSVKFSHGGFEAIEEPLWTEADAVVVAVPFYVDPQTHEPAAGTVDFSVSTDGSTYGAAGTLEISDLPVTASLPRGAVAATGYRLLALSAYHRATELAFWQAALSDPGNGSASLDVSDEIDAELELARDAMALAERIERDPGAFPEDALMDADRAFGLWLSAVASAGSVEATQDAGRGAHVSGFSTSLDMTTLEFLRTSYADIRATHGLTDLGSGGALQKMIGAVRALTGMAERLDVEVPGEFGAVAGIASAQTAAAAATEGFLDSFFRDVQRGITATVTGTDFEPTPLEQHARGLVDGFMEAGAEILSTVRGIPAGDVYGAFKDDMAVTEQALEIAAGDGGRAKMEDAIGEEAVAAGGGWVTGEVEGTRTESGLDPARVDLCDGTLARPMRAMTGAAGRYAIPAPARLGSSSCTLQAHDPVSEEPVTESTPVDLSALEDGEDVEVPPVPELPPAPDEYEADLAGAWGSVSGYGDCTWALSYDGKVTIVLPPDPADGGNVYVSLNAYWSGGSCEPWSGEGSATGEITMRTTNLFSATLNGFVEEHPMVFKIEGNSAGSTPWAKATVTVTWEPEVTPQQTESRVDLQFARR